MANDSKRIIFHLLRIVLRRFGWNEELCKQNCNNPLHLLYYQTESFNKNRTKLQLVKEYLKLKEASSSNETLKLHPSPNFK